MPVRIGSQFPYPELRQRYDTTPASPILWQWKTLAKELAVAEHTEYGSLSLSTQDGQHEIVPGAAMTFQVVAPGGRTTPHQHAWWHLYFVQAGSGTAIFADDGTAELDTGDVMLIPAWSMHRFENHSTRDMVLLNMSNQPQQAALSNYKVEQGEL
jgi:gentisate 1,2-dioxygenase